jgi:biopolymer transport protein ExbB/TolQ
MIYLQRHRAGLPTLMGSRLRFHQCRTRSKRRHVCALQHVSVLGLKTGASRLGADEASSGDEGQRMDAAADVVTNVLSQGGHGGGMSFLELFLAAHIVVKAVMIGLVIASVWSWAIIIEKLFAFRRARIEADRFEQLFWSGQSLEELYTTISRGRFIGLFGTVWGIMTSFQAIAVSKNTSLAVVAPGIAEALFATAIGLVAAIPAVIFYNKFSADAARLNQRLEAFSDEFSAIVSRQIDARG